ncbi:hypothetical protein ACF0H5_016011 [Mactra antiquata]
MLPKMSRGCLLSLSFPRFLKWIVIGLGIFFIIESIIFNTVILYSLWKFRTVLTQVLNAPGYTFIDKLTTLQEARDVINVGKEGGFTTLMRHTLGRVYVESLDPTDSCQWNDSLKVTSQQNSHLPLVSKFGIDVSNAGEALYLYRRIKQRQLYSPVKWKNLIVDIGANDGLLSSNSFNFIQWGWSAVLVEPQNYQLELAKRNLLGYTDQHRDQDVKFVNAVIGEKDGTVDFVLSSDAVAMESHVMRYKETTEQTVIKVRSFSVQSFTKLYDVPKIFGILSIDAEGMSTEILHQWIDLGYRPVYILYEALHEKEHISRTVQYLDKAGYTFLTKLGWNYIFEKHFP